MATRFQLGTISTQAAPAGAVHAFAGAAAPTGWLLCNGAAVSRATYAALFAAIASAHGSGDGSTTFNLPDYRGRIIRGVDGGIARDPDRAGRTASNAGGNTGDNVGSVQAQATKTPGTAFSTAAQTVTGTVGGADGSHTHGYNDNNAINAGTTGLANSPAFAIQFQNSALVTTTTGSPHGHSHVLSAPASTVNGGGDNETRPINAYVNYIIKV